MDLSQATGAKPIPAATLVLLRDRADAAPELLMIERAGGMAFAPGALVFPGGRVDPADHALAATLNPTDPDDDAARIAAIRETVEEVGIAVGLLPPPDRAALGTLRAGLAAGEPIAPLLAAAGLRLDLPALCPFARWLPAFYGHRVYDTRFYLARAPDDAAAAADGGESVRAIWTTADAALADADAGHHRIIFPTRRNLERLALAADHAAACAGAVRYPLAPITPRIETRDGEDWLCIPEDRGYPVTAQRMATVQRG